MLTEWFSRNCSIETIQTIIWFEHAIECMCSQIVFNCLSIRWAIKAMPLLKNKMKYSRRDKNYQFTFDINRSKSVHTSSWFFCCCSKQFFLSILWNAKRNSILKIEWYLSNKFIQSVEQCKMVSLAWKERIIKSFVSNSYVYSAGLFELCTSAIPLVLNRHFDMCK